MITDTADFNEIARFKPSEGTTNPSLLYLVAQLPQYSHILDQTVEFARKQDASLSTSQRLDRAVEYLAVEFGTEIYKLTGGISTEADVTFSFDVQATIDAALRIIALYAERGVPKSAVRIKISATWEGIQAARILENEHGIGVLITIVFGMTQAITAAEAGVTCIAPYVGRIGDWFKVNGGQASKSGADMGVARVQDMQDYIRKYGYKTKVMAASFRNPGQAIALAGVDLLTIAPSILIQLEEQTEDVIPQLTAKTGKLKPISTFDWLLIEIQQKFRRSRKSHTSMMKVRFDGPSIRTHVPSRSLQTL